MGRKFLMVLLGLGAVAGFGAGLSRLCHGSWRHYGHGGRWDRHAEFERRVADTCTESAKRAFDQKNQPGDKP
ncbi:MAG TPA: hypothetical protein VJN18_33300 [Polyangiaceae bacterium]|nr:hypothetical protein [Polyangiaceae bacterium]